MNKNIRIIVHILFLIILDKSLLAQNFDGGTGTESDPYKITTATQFNDIRNYLDSHFILMNDIDLSAYPVWTPIGKEENTGTTPNTAFSPFSGTLDGNGKIVTNLTIDYTGNYVGLFGVVGGTIKNLGVKGVCRAHAGNGHALLVGYLGQANGGLVENCWVDGTIEVDGVDAPSNGGVGLIVGTNAKAQSIIRSCYAKGKIINNGGFYTGAMCGRIQNKEAYVYNCYSEADVFSASTLVGGIVGQAYSNPGVPNVYNNYASGTVKGADMVGGVIGRIYTNSIAQNLVGINDSVIATSPSSQAGRVVGVVDGTLEEGYGWNGTKVILNGSEQTVENSSIGKDGSNTISQQLKDAGFYTGLGWDFNTVWTMPADGYPVLVNTTREETPTYTDFIEKSKAKIFAQGKLLHVRNIDSQTQINIYNLNGQKVSQYISDKQNFVATIPLHGFLIVQVIQGQESKTQKVYIAK